jgi:hypothetical protein
MAVNTAAAADSGNHLPLDRKQVEGIALAAIVAYRWAVRGPAQHP